MTQEKTTDKSKNDRQYHDDLAKQIEREDNLVNTRMSWLLTLQGFMFTALALITKANYGTLYYLLMVLLPSIGIVSSILGFFGVKGANIALRELKDKWNESFVLTNDDGKEQFVRPFGNESASKQGGVPSYYLPVFLTIVWLLIFGFAVCDLISHRRGELITHYNIHAMDRRC